MKNKILLIIIVLCSFSVVADFHEGYFEPDPSFAYTPLEGFDYQFGDYSTINDWSTIEWNQVTDWSKVYDNIPLDQIYRVPSENLDFSLLDNDQIGVLSESQRNSVKPEQIQDHLEKLGDLTRYNSAVPALKSKYGVVVASLGESAKLKNGVLKADFGENGELELIDKNGLPTKVGWQFEINEDGKIIVKAPREINEASISNGDSFTIQTDVESEAVSIVTSSGQTVQVNGLSFQEGRAYVKEGETALVGGNEISGDGLVNVYFKKGEYEGNYVVITENNLEIGSKDDGEVVVDVKPGNQLLNLVKYEYLKDAKSKAVKFNGQPGYEEGPNGLAVKRIPDERDTLKITVSGGDNLKVVSRANEGLTPLITHAGEGESIIETGRMTLSAKQGNFWIKPPKPFSGKAGEIDMRNSVAFELVSEDISNRIVTSSSNRYEFYDENGGETRIIDSSNNKLIGGSNMGLRISNKIEDNMMKTIEDLRYKYPNIEFGIGITGGLEESYIAEGYGTGLPEGYNQITSNMAQVTDEWLSKNPSLDKYLKRINYNVVDNAAASLYEMEFGERKIDPAFLREHPDRDIHSPLDIFDHEFVHTKDDFIKKNENSLSSDPLNKKGTDPFKTNTYLRAEENIQKEIEEKAVEEGIPITDLALEFQQRLAILKRSVFDDQKITFKYNKKAVEISKPIFSDERFNPILDEIDNLNLPDARSTKELFEDAGITHDINLQNTHTGRLSDLDTLLKINSENQNLPIKTRQEVQRIRERFNQVVSEQTGLYPYSFKLREGKFSELSSTFGEIDISTAKNSQQLRDLAQLEYDKVISLDPPQWMRQEADERYYAIMGGENGPICSQSENACGKCKLYTLTCKE